MYRQIHAFWEVLSQQALGVFVGPALPRRMWVPQEDIDIRRYLPFSASGGALLFHLLRKFYGRTSVVVSTSLIFSEWASVLGDASIDHIMMQKA